MMGAFVVPQIIIFRSAALPRLLTLIQNWNAQELKPIEI